MRDYKVSIVIPVYGNWHLLRRLLDGLHRYEAENIDDVIVVDDCSPDIDRLHQLFTDHPLKFSVLGNEENLGFTKTSNIGLRFATGELAEKKMIFLVSSDVSFHGRFVEDAEEILFSARRHFLGNRHIVFDSGWNNFNGKVFDYLEGWFLGATSDGWRDLGYFDVNYAPHDFEDVDISTTAKVKGYKLASLNNPYIQHLGGGTIGFNPEREAITRRNKEFFKRKWLGE